MATANKPANKLEYLRSNKKRKNDDDSYDPNAETKEDDNPNDILTAIMNMETRISNNIKSLEDTIADKVAAAIREKMEAIHLEFKKDISELYSRVSILEEKLNDLPATDPQAISVLDERVTTLENGQGPSLLGGRKDISLNMVIRNLPYRENEVPLNTVNCLIKDGLNIKDIECVSAERKQSYNDRPGVMIAKLSCPEQKKAVMSKKSTLKQHTVYKKVYINHDVPHEQRVMESSFHAILREMGTDKLAVRGGRIVKKTARQDHNNGYAAGGGAASRQPGEPGDSATQPQR